MCAFFFNILYNPDPMQQMVGPVQVSLFYSIQIQNIARSISPTEKGADIIDLCPSSHLASTTCQSTVYFFMNLLHKLKPFNN